MTATRKTTDYTDFAKRAFTPATRFNEVMVGNIERVARFQYELAGDLMQFALDQMNATVKAKDLPTLLSKQREIATKFAEKAALDQVKMIEIKLSQGAKPGHGGVLPAAKVSAEIAQTRGPPLRRSCESPSPAC